MMKDKALSTEEIGSIILAKEALSKLGYGSIVNVSSICKRLGLSRKSAYNYYKRLKDKKETEEIKDKEKEDILKENMLLRDRIKGLEIENRILNIVKRAVEYFNCGRSRRLTTDILIANGRYKEKIRKR